MIKIKPVNGESMPNGYKDRRFTKPPTDAELAFDMQDRMASYSPYLVRVDLPIVGTLLSFYGVNLDNGNDGTRRYTVDLTRLDHVWRGLPSTLDDSEEGANYAILFLTDAYLDEPVKAMDGTIAVARKDDLDNVRAQILDACPKWPCRTSAIFLTQSLRARIEQLEEENATLKAKNETLEADLIAARAGQTPLAPNRST